MWFSVCYKCRLRWFNVYWLNRNICQNVLDITASEYSCLLERCFAPTGKWYIDIPKKKIILLLAKNTENRFPCGPQTVTKLCCKAQCSLFITFIHCSYNSTVYGVSTQHKHHSTYPSMCHCYEPGHGLFWLNGRHCADALIHLYVYFLSQFLISVFEGGKRVRFTFISLLW